MSHAPRRLLGVVLAGGRGRRLGGVDKPALVVGGATLLDTAVAALAGLPADEVVVAGPARGLRGATAVRFVREEPPHGGGVAGLAAALASLPPAAGWVVVLAADLPRVRPEHLAALVVAAADAAVDGALAVDGGGRDQPLLAVYDEAALRRAVPDPAHGAAWRQVTGSLRLARVPLGDACADVDDPPALAAARADAARLTGVTSPDLDAWLANVALQLGIEPPTPAEVRALLDMTRDVAHGVERVAAPLTAYLVGLAGGAGEEQLAAVQRALAGREPGSA